MKIMHISDLHLGKVVNGFSMIDDQKHILKQVVEAVTINDIDILIIAGDIYDRPIAPGEAIDIFNIFLNSLNKLNTAIFIINGNHDSMTRLGFGNQIFENSNIHIVSEQTLFKKYQIDNINFFLCPFINLELGSVLLDTKYRDYTDMKRDIIAKMDINPNECNIIVDHSYIISNQSDIEENSAIRPLSLGGSEFTSSTVYKDFDLVLAGHIHRHSHIKPNIYYSGSILPYAAGEFKNKQGFYIHQIDESIASTYHHFNKLREMQQVDLYIEDIDKLTYSEDYTIINLLDNAQVINPLDKIRVKFPNVMQINQNNLYRKMEAMNTDTNLSLEHSFKEFFNSNSANPINGQQLNYFLEVINSNEEEEQ